ncbi:MAG: BatD family protein [Candidatus Omnitrophica bacterium]|nr:BatD family protein [Candidatus Omnitrophota bacterium]
MKVKVLIIALAFFLFLMRCVSAEITLKAQVDKLRLTTDEVLTYRLSVKTQEKNPPALTLPQFDGFAVVSQSQSSSFRMGRDEDSSFEYIFLLAPLSAGKLKIGPAVVKSKGRSFSSDAFEIEVGQGKRVTPDSPKVTL